jgi:hypothetical protein
MEVRVDLRDEAIALIEAQQQASKWGKEKKRIEDIFKALDVDAVDCGLAIITIKKIVASSFSKKGLPQDVIDAHTTTSIRKSVTVTPTGVGYVD